ncbi:MAG: diacylglycerol kinase family protein [bacterium]
MEQTEPTKGLIVNPRAWKVKKRNLEDPGWWRGLVPDENVWVTHDLDVLDRALAEARDKGVTHLAMVGGDGTLQVTLTHLISLWKDNPPAILPLPGGTMNALCSNLSIKGTPEEVLSRSMKALDRGRSSVAGKHLIHLTENDEVDRYGFTFANGVFFRAFGDYYRAAEPGIKDAVRVTIAGLASGVLPSTSEWNRLRTVDARVVHKNDVLADGPVRVITASTLDNPVLWFKPFPTMLNGRPSFHCIVNRMDAKDLLWNAWPLMRGKKTHPRHFVDQLDEIEIETDQGYILDGEVYDLSGKNNIKITAGPAFSFLVPPEGKRG